MNNENKNYVTGIIGGLIGGLVCAIPWVVMYAYGNMIISLLAIIIAYGVNFGYRKLNGKVDEKLPMIIAVISILVVVLCAFVINPLVMLYANDYYVSMANMELLYSNSEFVGAIIKDAGISVVFAIIGIAGVIRKVKVEVGLIDPETDPTSIAIGALKEKTAAIKEIFTKYNAMDKGSAIDVPTEIETDKAMKTIFNQLKIQQIIRKTNGKYYFDELREASGLKRFGSLYLKMMGILLVAVAVIVILVVVMTK